jgi:hypothetical protein
MRGFSSPNLHFLRVNILEWNSLSAKPAIERCLSGIIKRCPKLRILSFDFHAFPRYSMFNLKLAMPVTSPLLEELCSPPFSLETISTWSATTGWEALRTLKIDDLRYLLAFRGKVPCLRLLALVSIKIDFETLESEFHCQFPAPLKAVHFFGQQIQKLPLYFLSQYNPTVQELIFEEGGILNPDMTQHEIYLKSVDQLSYAVPHLQRLSLSFG